MFDKNAFKQKFRTWLVTHSEASEEDVRGFCEAHIPANIFLQNYWLVEQVLEWYRWQNRNKGNEPGESSLQECAEAS
jgi:hypothetical protein